MFFSAEIIRSKHFYEYSCLSSFFLRAGCSRIWFKLIASGFIQDIFDAAVYFSNHHIRILFFWTKQFFLCQNFQVYIISFAQNEQWSHHSEYQLNLHFIFSSLFLRRRVFFCSGTIMYYLLHLLMAINKHKFETVNITRFYL